METKNENNNKKGMTLDRLAEMMQGEFGRIDNRIGGIEKELGKRFEGIDRKFEGIDRKFEIMRKDFEKMDNRISGLEEELREKFDLVLDGQDKAAKWREDQEMEKTMSKSASRRHQDKLDDHEERIGVVENKLGVAGVAG